MDRRDRIVRSEGIPVGGWTVGGGKSGLTAELDALVVRAAGMLRDVYGSDVTIRFNSNRLSGSAWVVTDEVDAIGRNAEIGLRAQLVSRKGMAESIAEMNDLYRDDDPETALHRAHRRWVSEHLRALTDAQRHGRMGADGDTYLVIRSHIGRRALRDRSVADPDTLNEQYLSRSRHHATLEDGLAWVRRQTIWPIRDWKAPVPGGTPVAGGMRALVCGGREFADRAWLFQVLDEIAPQEIIHGGARGADRLAADWAVERRVDCHAFPADWTRNGKSAGFIRNQRMLDDGRPDIVVAFPGGKGTADMVARAGKAGMSVVMPEEIRALEQRLMDEAQGIAGQEDDRRREIDDEPSGP